MKENIKLDDFLAEVKKIDKQFAKETKPTYNTYRGCPVCSKSYGYDDNFCSKDGNKLEEIKYETRSEEAQSAIRRFFYDADSIDFPESFPFEFVETFESYEDCGRDEYWSHFVFKRKSDGKCFDYFMYDGRVEEDTMYEVKKVKKKKTTWE